MYAQWLIKNAYMYIYYLTKLFIACAMFHESLLMTDDFYANCLIL